MHRFRLLFFLPLAALLLACGDRAPAGADATAAGEESLPKPGAAGGSVTGMPAPGVSTPDPGQVDDAVPALETDGIAQAGATDPSGAQTEPGAEAALAVLRDYYAAINARDFARAYALWRQNPQTPAQFADGFAGTAGVSIDIGTPGPVDAGAGQRYIEIPVRLETTQANGQVERHAGRYVLHRSVVEGGNPDWRIERATLAKQ